MSARTIELILEATDRGAANAVHKVRTETSGLNTDLNSMKGFAVKAAGALGIAFGAREVLSFLFDTNRETEKLQARLRTFDGERAGAVFADIERFASSTPFQIGEITDAYVRLRAIGINPTEETLTAFGDTAASMGKDFVQYAEAVADASTGEFERLKEFGIKANSQGDQVVLQFRGRSLKVKKDAESIVDALEEIGNTEFAGGMAEQMGTIDGVISNLMDNLSTLARTIGEAGLNDLIKGIIGEVRDFTGSVAKNKAEIGAWMQFVIKAMSWAWDIIKLIKAGLTAAIEAVGVFWAIETNAILKLLNKIADGVNWLLDGFDKIPGIDIDFRIGGFQTIEWEHLLAGAADELGSSWNGVTRAVDDTTRSYWQLALAGIAAADAQTVAVSAAGDGLGGGSTARGAARGTGGLTNNKAAVSAIFGVDAATPNFSAPLFGEAKAAPFSAAGGAAAVLGADAMNPLALQHAQMLLQVGETSRLVAAGYAQDMEQMRAATETFADSVTGSIQGGVIEIFTAMGPALLGSLGILEGGMGQLGAAVASTLGDILVNAGTTIILTDKGFMALKSSLLSLGGGGGIVAGALLIAAGSAMRSAVSGFVSNPTGGGGGSGLSFSDHGRLSRGSAPQGRVEVHFPAGPALYDPTDFRQRAEFTRFLQDIAGDREIVFTGA